MDTQHPLTESQDPSLDRWMGDRYYGKIILDVLREIVERWLHLAQSNAMSGSVRTVPVFDEAHNQYQVLDMGWDATGHRIFQPVIHLELLNGKIWIQENVTDIDLAASLVERGVKASDIVLGLHSKSLRRFSKYAIE